MTNEIITEDWVDLKTTIEYKAEFIEWFSVCWICGKATDWTTIKKSEAEFLKNTPKIQKTCSSCSEAIRGWVVMICKWYNCYTKDPCNNIVVFDTEKVSKAIWEEVESWSSFEVYWCAACSPDKKIHMTKESLALAYNKYNKWK